MSRRRPAYLTPNSDIIKIQMTSLAVWSSAILLGQCYTVDRSGDREPSDYVHSHEYRRLLKYLELATVSAYGHTCESCRVKPVRPHDLKILNIRFDRLADRLLYLVVLSGMTLVVLIQANAKTLDEAFEETNASVIEIRTVQRSVPHRLGISPTSTGRTQTLAVDSH